MAGLLYELPVATARRRERMGRQLRHLEKLDQAWLAGEVGEAQVGLVTRARTPATEECLARDEQLLVDHARLGFRLVLPGHELLGGLRRPRRRRGPGRRRP